MAAPDCEEGGDGGERGGDGEGAGCKSGSQQLGGSVGGMARWGEVALRAVEARPGAQHTVYGHDKGVGGPGHGFGSLPFIADELAALTFARVGKVGGGLRGGVEASNTKSEELRFGRVAVGFAEATDCDQAVKTRRRFFGGEDVAEEPFEFGGGVLAEFEERDEAVDKGVEVIANGL